MCLLSKSRNEHTCCATEGIVIKLDTTRPPEFKNKNTTEVSKHRLETEQ